MTDEVEIVDTVQVEVKDLTTTFDSHAAIPAAEPLAALFTGPDGTREVAVHGFTANGRALVLNPSNGYLQPISELTEFGRFGGIHSREGNPASFPIGPFTPAPPGMVAISKDGTRTPVVFYDVHGRPCVIDNDETSRQVRLAIEDSELAGIHGGPGWETGASGNTPEL